MKNIQTALAAGLLSLLAACSLSDTPQTEIAAQATPRLICLDERYTVTCQITSATPSTTTWRVYGGSLLTSGSTYAHVACSSLGGFVNVSARVAYESRAVTLDDSVSCDSGLY